MKMMIHTAKAALLVLALCIVAVSCKKSAPLSIDPIEQVAPFSFEPKTGFSGQDVKITGEGLNDVTKVSFVNSEATIQSKTATQIMVKVPVGAISGKIKLVKANSVITSIENFTVDLTPVPTITSFAPQIASSGDVITITGTLLDRVDSLYVGALRATIQQKTATQIRFAAPTGLKTGFIQMYYMFPTSYGIPKKGVVTSSSQLSLQLPIISSITPDISALNIGDEITINGTMMNVVTRVQFGTLNATFTAVSASVLRATVPAGATTGKIVLTVPDGTTESTGNFQVNLPTITSFFPFKGAEIAGGVRDITLTGTRFDLVTTARIGTNAATIMAQTPTNITIRISGAQSGVINLVTANGVVSTTSPFIITGNFWLADYDNMYTPVRLFNEPMYTGAANSEQFVDFAVNSKTIVSSGLARGNYRRWDVSFTTSGSPRMYFRGDQGGSANPAPDRFLLYTNSSVGVNFEFDISWDVLPTELLDANNFVTLKVLFFNADQTAGGGYGYYTDLFKVKYDGPGIWQKVTINTNTTRVGNDSFMYNNSFPAASSARFAPNNCRIICVMFSGAYQSGGTQIPGKNMVVNFDNVRFVIN